MKFESPKGVCSLNAKYQYGTMENAVPVIGDMGRSVLL